MTKRREMSRYDEQYEYADATPTEWAYLAGILDGEGTIGCYGGQQPRAMFTQKDPVIVQWAYDRFGGRVGLSTREIPRQKNPHQISHRWGVYSKIGVKDILTGCLPYLILKRTKAEEVLRVIG